MNNILKNTLQINIEFGDTDPESMVHYPNFFKWFDAGTWRLFMKAGLSRNALQEEFGLSGIPLIQTNSNFKRPVYFGDTALLTTYIKYWGTKSLCVAHEFTVDEQLCAQCEEIRALVQQKAGGGIESVVIADAIKLRLPALEEKKS